MKPSKPIIATLTICAMTAVVFVLLEGVSSTLLGIYHASRGHQSYHEYDDVIGWTGRPNTFYPDFFGPGKEIRINSQGFREASESPPASPPGKIRILCSGDSFTFGQGVANDETWCHQLQGFLAETDTVNLGQSGYGVDQAYLWYMKAGQKLEHRVHVFAFIGGDLDRMGVSSNWDTGKPVLRLSGDEIEVSNVPVPRARHWLARKLRAADLRMVTLSHKILARIGHAAPDTGQRISDETRKVARRVFEKLVAVSSTAGRETLFVFLPTEADLGRDTQWREWTSATMADLHYEFADLTPAMRQLPASTVAQFFIEGGESGGHYTDAGNRWVAQTLAQEMVDRFKLEPSAMGGE